MSQITSTNAIKNFREANQHLEVHPEPSAPHYWRCYVTVLWLCPSLVHYILDKLQFLSDLSEHPYEEYIAIVYRKDDQGLSDHPDSLVI